MRGWLLVNPLSGDGSGTAELSSAAAARGIDTHVLQPGDDAEKLAREADADALGAAGGDGTLAAVAAVSLERGMPFVCVPFGTRNHFARDLGLDRSDPVAALEAFEGDERLVDIGRVNDRVFLNNVSIGAYAVLVHHGWRRVLDAVRLPHRLTLDGEKIRTRLLLVANNSYSLSGTRDRLDEGQLHVYTPRGEIRVAERVVIGAHSRQVRAAIDGESAVLRAPLEISIERAALRVLVPRSPVA